MDPVRTYLDQMLQRRAIGNVKGEESYYSILESLLSGIGSTLSLKVRCAIQIGNDGKNYPDGGLFTSSQAQQDNSQLPLLGQKPARGALEAKDVPEDLVKWISSPQVDRYVRLYGQVLLTNYRDFALLVLDSAGVPVLEGQCTIAQTASEFWKFANNPTAELQESLSEFLKRALLRQAPITAPEDLAFILASYAREARIKVETRPITVLDPLRATLEDSLGLKFRGRDGEHFFKASLIQTVFYGMFSAWVTWCESAKPPNSQFNWRASFSNIHVPALQALFVQIALPQRLKQLGIEDLLENAAASLDRVDQAQFFGRFGVGRAIEYFYEPFLKAYDPELRTKLGVWFTPHEIVHYMVARVDQLLVTEFGLIDGLADPSVMVLDPACGTGAFLLEALRVIHARLEQRYGPSLAAARTKDAALQRLFGFELLPAPLVVAHLQVGMLLRSWGVPLAGSGDRPPIFLTNSLTGWKPGNSRPLPLPELTDERDLAADVKQNKRVLVVLGNPPYDGFAGVSPDEEGGLVEPYKKGLRSTWNIKRSNLNDLYIRFIRLAERRIVDQTGEGIVALITNFSYLHDPSAVVMRQRLIDEFPRVWIDNLNGDSRETGKKTPEGEPDPSAFSTPATRGLGIRKGTAIAMFVRPREAVPGRVRYRDFWGVSKRENLVDSLQSAAIDADYETLTPERINYFRLRPSQSATAYYAWPRIDELAEVRPSLGVLENRRESLIDIDRSRLEARLKVYLDPAKTLDDARELGMGLTDSTIARFDVQKAWTAARAVGYDPSAFRLLLLRPFDIRWCYYAAAAGLWNEPRIAYVRQIGSGLPALVSRRQREARDEGTPFNFTSLLGYQHSLQTDAYYFPVTITIGQGSMQANLSPKARKYLQTSIGDNPDQSVSAAARIWRHVLAVGLSDCYLKDHYLGIGEDFPRIPLPASAAVFHASAQLGQQMALLLDPSAPVPNVTAGAIRPDLANIARLEGGSPLNLNVEAVWGRRASDGVVMPGEGRMDRRSRTPSEQQGLAAGVSFPDAIARLGSTVVDIHLNGQTKIANVPERVWEYRIGGFQVIKKWLSYRGLAILERPLTGAEAEYLVGMIRRIAAVLLAGPELDANYEAILTNQYTW